MADRADVSFDSGGVRCAAWLYRPSAASKQPLVVLGHGLTAVRDMRLDAYAERFAAAGLAALAFDYRGFGGSGGEPRDVVDIDAQLEDWAAAIAYARSLEWVDADRVALWGTSLGGGHVAAAGARDGRVAAIVSQCPFADGPAQVRHQPGVMLAFVLAGAADAVARRAGRGPLYLPLTRTARRQTERIVPPGSSWGGRLSARVGLGLPRYRPFLEARDLRCPWLVCLCEHDRVTPAGPARALAERNGSATVRSYAIGHYDIYLGEWFERAASDQVEFLVGALSARSG